MDFLTIALAVGGLFVAGFVILYVTGITELLRFRFQRGSVRLAAREEVAEGFEELYRHDAAVLAELGFEEPTWVRDTSMVVSSRDVTPTLVLRHPSGVIATLGLGDPFDDHRPVMIVLTSYLAGGRVVRTFNQVAHQITESFGPEELVSDPMVPSLRLHLAAHEEAVARAGAASEPIDIAEHVARTDAFADARHRRLLDSGEGRVRGSEIAPTFGWARKTAARTRAGEARRVNMIAREKPPPSGATVMPAIRAFAYARGEEIRARRSKRAAWLWMLVASGVAFAASMAGLFDASTALVLVLVVIFHELGHYAAMRLSGYRNVSIFFIPFFGGAATGERVRPTLAKEMFVLLAGPLPGLLLAVPLAIVASFVEVPLLDDLVLWLALVNAANLLPIHPLDGGRIAHAIVGTRFAAFAIVARVAAIAVFGAAFLFLDDTISLLLAISIALAFPNEIRLARLEAMLRRAGVDGPDVERIVAEGWSEIGKQAPARRRLTLRMLVDRMAAPLPGLGARFAAASIYGAAFVGATFITVVALASLAPAPELATMDCSRDLRSQLVAEGPAHWVTHLRARFPDREAFELARADLHSLSPASSVEHACAPWHPSRPASRDEEKHARRTLIALEDLAASRYLDEPLFDDGVEPRAFAVAELTRTNPPWLDHETLRLYREASARPLEPHSELGRRIGADPACATGAPLLIPLEPLESEQPSSDQTVNLVVFDDGERTDHAEQAFRYLCTEGAIEVAASREVGAPAPWAAVE